jgi:hypothetical protein
VLPAETWNEETYFKLFPDNAGVEGTNIFKNFWGVDLWISVLHLELILNNATNNETINELTKQITKKLHFFRNCSYYYQCVFIPHDVYKIVYACSLMYTYSFSILRIQFRVARMQTKL